MNSPSDVVGAAPLNDGICATAYNNGVPNGVCTLRAAVMEANHAPGGPHTIILSPNTYTLTILPAGANDETTGDLNITANMNIVGESAFTTIIDGNGSVTRDRVFSISLFIAVKVSGVTIRNGAAPTDGGGILALGPLTLTNSRVINNSAARGQGGGILNDGSRGFPKPLLTLINSAVSENIARDFGGGISVIVADMVLINSTVSGNAAVGGALFVDDGSGGGIATFNSNVTLVNSTVSGNNANQSGGGIFNRGGTANAFNSTIADNRSDADSNGSGIGGGVFNQTGATFNFQNTILANNQVTSNPNNIRDCAGALISQGYNLIRIPPPEQCNVTPVTGDLFFFNPLLGPLQNNGGPTQTHALLTGSPAIDGGNPSGCRDNLGALVLKDQRGFRRAVDGNRDGTARCDIGAAHGSFFDRVEA